MAITLGVDGFSVATDITRLTGAEYTADSMPTLAQVEEAIQDAFAIISARLVAVGLGEGPYDDDNLISLARPVSSRLAASQLLFGEGDVERGQAYFDQAETLLNQIGSEGGLRLSVSRESESQLPYGSFGSSGTIGTQEGGLPVTVEDIYLLVKAIIHQGNRIDVDHNDVSERIIINADLQVEANPATQDGDGNLSSITINGVNWNLADRAELIALDARVAALEPVQHVVYVGWSADNVVAQAEFESSTRSLEAITRIPASTLGTDTGYLFFGVESGRGYPRDVFLDDNSAGGAFVAQGGASLVVDGQNYIIGRSRRRMPTNLAGQTISFRYG